MHPAIRVLAIPLLILGCQRAGAEDTPPPVKKTEQIPLSEHAALLPAIQVDSLTLTPVVATETGLPKQDLDAMTLDEAFGQKLVSIKENESESVNHLTLTNKASRPLFMLAGEVIIGGKQDRIIGQNTIIAANTTQVVPVFCVEHGRWDQSSKVFTSGKALAHGRLRGQASFENQGEVWREVAAKNALRKTQNATDTYRQVATQQSNGTLAGSEGKVKAALAKLLPDDRSRMIGYVVSLNGKVATVDMFDSPKLFKKLEDKLVRSYLTESIDIVAQHNIKPPTPTDVKTFMADADKAVAEKSYENAAASTVRYKGAKHANKAIVELKEADDASRAKASPKKSVYKTYQAK
jgi:hypothetical protein